MTASLATASVSILGAVSALFAPLSASAPQEAQAAVAPHNFVELEGTQWHLADGPSAYFTLENGQVSGNDSCNTIGGTAKVEGEHILFGDLFSTRMACPATEKTSAEFLKAIGGERIVALDGAKLTLKDAATGESWDFEAK